MKRRKIISIQDVRFLAMQALETGDTKELEAAFDSLGISGQDLDGPRDRLLAMVKDMHNSWSEMSRQFADGVAELATNAIDRN